MKLAVQENRVPGATLTERVALAEDMGFEGMEFWGADIAERVPEIIDALRGRQIRPCTICAGYDGALICADPKDRAVAREGILRLLRIAGDLGMVGLIVVPGFQRHKSIPDLSPFKSSHDLETEVLVAQLQEMAPEAEKTGAVILLEPLNRYESHYLNRQMDAVSICKRVGSPSVQVLCDFFHMNIEEYSTPDTLCQVGTYCKHVHLADNTRQEPGSGSIDFRAGFAALKQIGFAGYMAYECGFRDHPNHEARLRKSVDYLKKCMT
jgi:sugar phosphate isomerase/epimerase